ncbi:MAG: OmpA family protein [Myxococcaceae bacterium]
MRRLGGVLAVVLSGCVTASAVTVPPRANARPDAEVAELVRLEGERIVVKEAISFPHGSAEIEERSMDLLDAIARIMQSTASIKLLTVEGHTDTTGEPELNQPLSEARALAVRKYLEGKGVAPSRLESVGYGSERPLDGNDSEPGRARNRRVEFKVTR